MGVCLSCKTEKKKSNLSAASTDITYFQDQLFYQFKHSLIKECEKRLPLSSTELQKLFSSITETSKQKIMKENPSLNRSPKSFAKLLKFFEFRCKAAECYFMYLNDLKSLELVRDLKAKYLMRYFQGDLDRCTVLNCYFNDVQGSYELQGFDEICFIIDHVEEELCLDFIDSQFREELNKLTFGFKEIANCKAVDEDIYWVTLGKGLIIKQ